MSTLGSEQSADSEADSAGCPRTRLAQSVSGKAINPRGLGTGPQSKVIFFLFQI